MNMKKFIYETAGGIPNGKKLKAVIPGGSSCPLMSASEIDIPWITTPSPKPARCSAPAAWW